MAKIRINFAAVQSTNNVLKKLNSQMLQIEDGLAALQRDIDSRILQKYEINQKFKVAKSTIKAIRTKSERLYRVVKSGEEQYRNTEARLNKHTPNDK